MELLLGLAGLALGIVLGWFAARARSDQGTKDAIAAAGRAEAARSAAEARLDEQLRGFQTQLQRSEEHTSELQSRGQLVCRLLLEKKKPVGGGHIGLCTLC